MHRKAPKCRRTRQCPSTSAPRCVFWSDREAFNRSAAHGRNMNGFETKGTTVDFLHHGERLTRAPSLVRCSSSRCVTVRVTTPLEGRQEDAKGLQEGERVGDVQAVAALLEASKLGTGGLAELGEE